MLPFIVIPTAENIFSRLEKIWRWFGRADIVELVRIFEKQNPDLPMRVVHGMYNSFSLVIFLSKSAKSDL